MGVRAGRRTPTVIPGRARRSETGAVTAEAALVIPVLVGVVLALVWVLALVGTQTRVVDAAREAARLAARGESPAAVVSAARAVAPAGATVRVRRSGGQVVAVVTAAVRGPGGLVRFLGGVTVRSEAVAVPEPGATP